MSKKTVMILDANTRIALALTRDFGLKGINVITGGTSRLSRSFYSKHSKAHFLYPSKGDIHEVILFNVKKFKPDTIIPVLDNSFEIMIKNRQEYSLYTNLIPLPPYAAFNLVRDKYSLMRHASESNIQTPQTFYLNSIDEAENLKEILRYPVIIKPRLSAGGFGMDIVKSSNSLLDKIIKAKYLFYPDLDSERSLPIIQEYIEGEVVNFYAYCEKGNSKVIYMTKTIRQYPVKFGPPIAIVSIKDKIITDISINLLKSLEWEGVICLQYIIDKKDGVPKLIDANPRLWGAIEAAMVYGVNFPQMLFKKAIGEELDIEYDYSVGKKFRWILFGEAFYLLRAGNRIRTVINYLDFKNMKCEISLCDILPHFAHLLSLLINRSEVR
ncbi:MAG: ATP-grasp domain-containing protein [Candidatus Omnitrophica bacterium]|nr:ATP-grasp domain-containing protein [Candidatus Omnitrophota bacterium]MBU1929820.1 ATP-grasp domain-containing protein [Candidatus Omnitrophota bacterium]MBU2035332.1 ATP-grasp domain-containing protein [Candidatus Omnitrophota bacterium]